MLLGEITDGADGEEDDDDNKCGDGGEDDDDEDCSRVWDDVWVPVIAGIK